MKKEIYKIMVLSTGHLPEDEFKALESVDFQDHISFYPIQHDYGTIVSITDKEDIKETRAKFPVLAELIEYAIENEIKYLNFDEDGSLYDDFKQFDW